MTYISSKFYHINVTLLTSFINLSRSDLQIALWSRSSIPEMQMCKVYFDSIIVAHSRGKLHAISQGKPLDLGSLRIYSPIYSHLFFLSATSFRVSYFRNLSEKKYGVKIDLNLFQTLHWFSHLGSLIVNQTPRGEKRERERATQDANVTAWLLCNYFNKMKGDKRLWLFRERTRSRSRLECILALRRATMQHPVPSSG